MKTIVAALFGILLLWSTPASADSVSASFDISPTTGAIGSSIGTMDMTLNGDGSIGITVDSVYPIYWFFFEDTNLADFPLIYSGLGPCYSPIGGASGGGWANAFDAGFIANNGCYNSSTGWSLPSSVSFSVSGQQPFNSVSEFVGLGPIQYPGDPVVEFVSGPPYGGAAAKGANVPEPSSLALFLLGLLLVGLEQFRRRSTPVFSSPE
jgi:hypothetical protein